MNDNWNDVCGTDDLIKNSGVCALINGKEVAIFSQLTVANDSLQNSVYASENYDPIGRANVLYRGLLGSVADKTVVASPLYKQRYCLQTGQCLDDDSVKIDVYPARVVNDRVLIKMDTAQ